MALDWQTVHVGFTAGLDTEDDVRAGQPPKLDICRDVQFDEHGGVQPRLPFAAMSNAIFGGGSLSACRRIEVVNGELILFTSDSLYSWNAQLSAWVLRGTHLAVAVNETPVFATTADQFEGDRAELAGTVLVAWNEGGVVWTAALDKTTGSVLLSPFSQLASSSRPRLVALSTKILMFFEVGTALKVFSIDPASPLTALGGGPLVTVLAAGTFNLYYDVVRAGTQDLVVGACRRVTTTSYTAFTVTPALTVTTVTPARTCDGPIAVSAIPDGTKTQIVRANGTNIQGDLLTTSTLADVFTAQAVGTVDGTPVNQIAAAHRSVQNGGAFRCYAFWSAQESAVGVTWRSKFNFVDSGNTLGTQASFVRQLGVASRAFDYNGSVYVWLAFAGQTTFNGTGSFAVPAISLQNTYFLHRDDAFLVAKSIAGHGGGFSPSTGRLPGVALTSGSATFSWCATQRRRIVLNNDSKGFAAREPVDVAFTFDTNTARRCDQLGQTLYIAAGELLQYDGTRITEVGFHIYPWVLSMIDSALGGSVAVGTYAYKGTWRSMNAQGESERSTTATVGEITVTGNSVTFPTGTIAPLTVTHKTVVPPAVEFWRSAISPQPDSPYFLITSNDPAALVNPNRYEPNDPTVTSLPQLTDFLSDTTLTTFEANPENGSVLENLSPPPAQIILSGDTRIHLAGVAGDPDRVWYSLQRAPGSVAAFNDGLTVSIPRTGGDITAQAFNAETWTVFRETAIYALPGDGFDNAAGGSNFGPARIISLDVGAVNQESVAFGPMGVVFKSSKGWYLLSPNWQVQYIGGPVKAFDADTVLAVHIVETQHQVRILTNARMIVWDYLVGQWGEWTISDGVHATIWNGSHVYLTATGPKLQATSYSGLTYGVDVETSWIKPAEQQGEVTLRWLAALGEYRSVHLMRVRVARDYAYDGSGNVVYFDDTAWTPSPTVVGSALQVKHTPSKTRAQSIKVRLTAVVEAVRASLATGSALSPVVATSGTTWASTWAAVSTLPGEMGNVITLALSFESGANLVDVRDHYTYSTATGRWAENLNRIGVRVVCTAASLTVAALETAIAAGTKLATLTAADATPGKTINIATMAGQVATGAFTGGAYGAPTGDACKLTGLALEIGLQRGINKRLPAAQKVA